MIIETIAALKLIRHYAVLSSRNKPKLKAVIKVPIEPMIPENRRKSGNSLSTRTYSLY